MKILEKIEEIKRQPEHIRLRWVWGMTVVCMLGIILLWIIILKSQSFEFSQDFPSPDSNFSVDFNEQKKSIKDALGQMKGAINDQPQTNSSVMPDNSDNTDEGFSYPVNGN